MLNGQYIEVVCPLDHPATDATPFGKIVKNKADAGGGWLTWVFSVNNISEIEKNYGRKFSEGARVKPDGTCLKWKQIGIKELETSGEMPFFIEWVEGIHPSKDGIAVSRISKLSIISETRLKNAWFANDLKNSMRDVSISWEKLNSINFQLGIIGVEFNNNSILIV